MDDEPRQYLIERVSRALARDPRVNVLDVEVTVAGGRVFLTGSVPTQARKEAISHVVRELLPEYEICNETTVVSYAPATESEDIA